MPTLKFGITKGKILVLIAEVYSVLLFLLLFLIGISNLNGFVSWFLVVVSVLIVIYFPVKIFLSKKYPIAFNILLILDLILLLLILASTLVSIRAFKDLIISAVFIPPVAAFLYQLKDKIVETLLKFKLASTPNKLPQTVEIQKEPVESISDEVESPIESLGEINEEDQVVVANNQRRKFLKLMVTAGLGTTFLLLAGRRKAEAAFFGSVPGTGTIGVKDVAGNKIDPAVKSPTDGFGVTEISNASYPYYFGFVHYNGVDWYILKQESTGAFSYASKYNNSSTNYATAWTTKASTLVYGTYSNAFMLP